MEKSDPRATAPAPYFADLMIVVGAAGLVLGASALVTMLALPLIGLAWYGALLVLLGLAQLVELGHRTSRTERTVRALLAMVYVGSGAAVAFTPSIPALPLLVAVLFICAGFFRIVWTYTWPGGSRVWGTIEGLVTAAIGLIFLAGEPGWVLASLGAAAALDLILYGVSAILLGRTLRSQSRPSAAHP